MAVVTPEGIVGKVIAVYPLASQVLLVTDPTFTVGVESQKVSYPRCPELQEWQPVHCRLHPERGENRSGRMVLHIRRRSRLPQGLSRRCGGLGTPWTADERHSLNLSGSPGAAEEVLVVLEGSPPADPRTYRGLRFDAYVASTARDGAQDQQAVKMQTEADKIKQKYQDLGAQENHVYGGYLSNLPNFNAPLAG